MRTLQSQTETEKVLSEIGYELARAYQCATSPISRWPTLSTNALGLLEAGTSGWLSMSLEDLLISNQVAVLDTNLLTYPKTADDVRHAFIAKHAIVVQNLQMRRGPLNVVCAEMVTRLQKRVAISCYLSNPCDQTFEDHFDGWDSVLIQLRGTKTFTIDKEYEISLRPGDVFFMKEGVIHRAAADSPSIHLAFASEANRMVHQSFIAMYKNKLFKGYATTASIHVWEVPALYRKVFPYRWRRWADENLKGLVSKIPYRPTLQKVVKFRIEDQPMSGIEFKKGVGLVGMCMEENIRERVHSVDFADPVYVAALKGTEEDWSNQSKSITRGLTLKQALILSERYRGALAVVIQTPLGEPIGCCTLEVPAESDLDIIKSTQAKADLRRLAQLVEPTLLLKSEKKGSKV